CIGREDVLEGEGVDCRQLVGVHLANRALDLGVALVSGLQQDTEFGFLLDLSFPAIDALDFGNLRARREVALDQRAPQALRLFAAAHGGDDGDASHPVRSAGTMTILRRSLPAITDRLTTAPIRSAPSSRTRSSAPVTGSPSSDSTMLPT